MDFSRTSEGQGLREGHTGQMVMREIVELAGDGDGLLAVGCRPDHFRAIDRGQCGDQAVPEERVIVGDDDPQCVSGFGALLCRHHRRTGGEAGHVARGRAARGSPGQVGVDFDLKTSMEDATRDRDATTAALLAGLAAREARRRPVLITSFDPGALDIAREIAPSVPRGLLTWLDFPVGQAVAAAAHLDVHVLGTTAARCARTASSPSRNAAHSTTSSTSSTRPVGSSSPGAPGPSSPPS